MEHRFEDYAGWVAIEATKQACAIGMELWAEEIAQEAALKVYRCWNGWAVPYYRVLIQRSAVDTTRQIIGRRKDGAASMVSYDRLVALDQGTRECRSGGAPAPPHDVDSPRPDVHALWAERRQQLRERMDGMSSRHRRMVELVLEGETLSDAAGEVGVSEARVCQVVKKLERTFRAEVSDDDRG